MSAQELFDRMNGSHWGWWTPILLLALANLWYMAKLSAPETVPGKISRYLIIIGSTCHVVGFFYGLCGFDRMIWGRMGTYGVMGGVTLLIRQIALACVAKRKVRAFWHPQATFGRRVLASLVDPPHL